MGADMAPGGLTPAGKMAAELLELLKEVTIKKGVEGDTFIDDIGEKLPDGSQIVVRRRAEGLFYYVKIRDSEGNETNQSLSVRTTASGQCLESIPKNVENLLNAVRGLRDFLATRSTHES